MSNLLNEYENKKVAVLGLGRSGLSAAKALRKAKANIICWDDREEARDIAKRSKLELCSFEEDDDFKDVDRLVLSPGIPHNFPRPHPIVARAQNFEIPVISDIELLREGDDKTPLIAVTGTNGKSTTTALIGHILSQSRDAQIGGNIGVPVMDLKKPKKDGAYVFEVSSYQLELTPSLKPKVSVLLNISPDHLDRHGGLAGYVQAKSMIFDRPADEHSVAVICLDDPHSIEISEKLREKGEWKVVTVSAFSERADADIVIKEGVLTDKRNDLEIDLNKNKRMKGVHNHQNAAAAYAALHYGFDVTKEAFEEAFLDFEGLKHRQYLVRNINGVPYVNDSKATNANASESAIATHKKIYWIVGGRSKEGGLDGLERYSDHIHHAFLIGESADEFSKWMQFNGVAHDHSLTLDIALAKAHKMVQDDRGAPGGAGVVLLSPAAASFDQFASFEERGDAFENLVLELEEGL